MDSQSEISPKPTSLEEPRKFTRRNLLSRVASVIAATVGVKYGEKLLPTEKSSSEKIAYAAIAKSEQDNLIQDQFKQHRESIPDGIPSEELESHNIFIFPNEKVDLVIRRGALEQEPLFQKVYSAAETSEEGKPILNIVLVDNTWLDTSRKTVSTVPSQFQEHFRNALLNVQKTTPIMFMEGYYERDPSTNIYTIYLATGGYRMPTPEKSNPQLSDLTNLTPEQLREKNPKNMDLQGYFNKKPDKSVGFALRHELKHVLGKSETDTDLEAFESIIRGEQNFVFITEEGVSYMKDDIPNKTTQNI